MTTLTIHLFGRAAFEREGAPLPGFHSGKVQELFCYLLLQRERLLAREVLAGVFWEDCTTVQSRKYLRQALWHLQCVLSGGVEGERSRVLIADAESVGIDPSVDIWLDVKFFEQAFNEAQGTRGDALTEHQVRLLKTAVQLYRGDLLEGWYQDWCLFQRERLQNQYLVMLDKLMAYCETTSLYQLGLQYGERVLLVDRAHERTHRTMVKLLYLSGDRAGALRQYDRCVCALANELDVKPSAKTQELYAQVRADCLDTVPSDCAILPSALIGVDETLNLQARSPLPEILHRLHNLEDILSDAQVRVRQNIQVVEHLLHRGPVVSLTHNKRRAV